MESKRINLKFIVVLLGLTASFVLVTAFAQANPLSSVISTQEGASDQVQSPASLAALPLRFPDGEWPWYAQGEIYLNPELPMPGSPVEVCAVVVNDDTRTSHIATLQFGIAPLGIGVPYAPVGEIEINVPAGGTAMGCIGFVFPELERYGIEVLLFQAGSQEPLRSLRNIDANEPLKPGEPHEMTFPVGNPLQETATITLGLIPHLPDWGFELSQDVLRDMTPGEVRPVTLTVIPPAEVPLPADYTPIVDVEAYAGDTLIGGFRKIFRPPIPLHPFPDPVYAEREISINPYPPLAGEPTEICVELRNPTDTDQDVTVQFSWASFGIGLPFTPINGVIPVHLPAYSVVRECIHWVPPISGHLCLQVKLELEGYLPQFSQRNIDVNEPLQPGEPHEMTFPVGNPLQETATITLGLIPHLPDWGFELSPDVLLDMTPGEVRPVTLTVIPPAQQPLPPDFTPIVDVEAYAGNTLIGGFRKVFRPPIPLHPFPDPIYAEREITVDPYPTLVGQPTEICVELRNPTDTDQDVTVQFYWADFGIGLPFTPIGGPQTVHLPAYSVVKDCIYWVPPVSGHVCLQVSLEMVGYEPQFSQRNIDINEPLEPGISHQMTFPVGNPLQETATITLGLIPHLPDWGFELSPDVLPDVPPGAVVPVTLTVIPPAQQPLPPDYTPIVDVEAYANGGLIGGFRKIFRPPVPIHIPGDPIYAESEISVNPYPPRATEPTEIIVEVRNPTDVEQTVSVTFSVAEFGIGLPFAPIAEYFNVIVPPLGATPVGVVWIPPYGGLFCVQVEIAIAGYQLPFISQRNIDVGEPLEPLVPHARTFLVGNPLQQTATITLGLVPHLPDWGLELSDYELEMAAGEVRSVTLTVTPPAILPPDGTPIVDVEAFVDGELIGGFRKLFRPPVPIHRPNDPIYAESEIGVDPYPVIPGMPTTLSVEVFNPTNEDHIVTATFSIAPFGIGLPFDTSYITPNPVQIFVPANGAARGSVIWTPPEWEGKFCVRVTLQMEGYEPIWSQRNIDVGEPLEPGVPHAMTFPVGSGDATQTVDIILGMVLHKDGWQVSLSDDVLEGVEPGEIREVTLTVTPPQDAILGTGEPIVDVEAFVEGELLGGFRKLDVPPVPIHKPHERVYSESEISIEPYPPQQGQPTTVSVVVYNTSDVEITVDLEFGWANFGMGIPFTSDGMVPATRTITLGPYESATVSVEWTPILSGPQCIIIYLTDPEQIYEPQQSQRNVDVVERPPCGTPEIYTFTIYNDSPISVTVDLGMITFNVPADWVITLDPSGSVEIDPYGTLVVEVHVTIPCPTSTQASLDSLEINAIQAEAEAVPVIDVEGYVDGELLGGIEIQFESEVLFNTLLPIIQRQSTN